MLDLTVVVATRNEEANVGPLLDKIMETFEDTGDYPFVLFVDDSIDKTSEMIESHAYPHKRVFHREERDRKGLLSALAMGILLADTTAVAVMDADGQHPASALKLMYDLTGLKAEYVGGSRYIRRGDNEGLEGFHRKLFSRILRFTPKVLLRLPLSDPLTNFCTFRKEHLDELKFVLVVRPGMMRVQPAVLVSGDFRRIMEVPFSFARRMSRKSNQTFKSGLDFLQEMIWLKRFKKMHNID